MLSLPKLFFTFILHITQWIYLSLISLKSKILPPQLILISLDRRGFEVLTISAANFSPMEQKYSFIHNTLFVKNDVVRFFQADNIRRLGSFLQQLINGLPRSFIFPLLSLILSEKYCFFNA